MERSADDSGAVSFSLSDTRYVRVASDNRLAIGLSAAKLASLSATAGFGAGDTLSVTAGFLADPAGWTATSDALDRADVWIFGAASQTDSQVDVRDELRLSFPDNLARGTGLIQLVRADGLLEESFDAATSTALSFAGQTLTINPSRMLQGSYAYSVTIANGMVVALDLVNDTLPEGMETLTLRLDSVAGSKSWYPLGIHREATYPIEDNDAHSLLVGFESLATLAGED